MLDPRMMNAAALRGTPPSPWPGGMPPPPQGYQTPRGWNFDAEGRPIDVPPPQFGPLFKPAPGPTGPGPGGGTGIAKPYMGGPVVAPRPDTGMPVQPKRRMQANALRGNGGYVQAGFGDALMGMLNGLTPGGPPKGSVPAGLMIGPGAREHIPGGFKPGQGQAVMFKNQPGRFSNKPFNMPGRRGKA